MKKAAMFGLDARIALAIFGALSVISGAALYSAIEETKTTSYIVEFNEIGKAWEQYLLDVGSPIPSSTSSAHLYFTETLNLIENTAGVNNWNGPYLSASKYVDGSDANGAWMQFNDSDDTYRALRILKYRSATNGDCAADDCYIWLRADVGNDSLSLLKSIDKKIDGDIDSGVGDFRYINHTTYYEIIYKYAPVNYNLVF